MSAAKRTQVQQVVQSLGNRVKRIINDKRITVYESMSTNETVDGMSVEMTVGNLHAKTLKEVEDMLFACVRRDTSALDKEKWGWKKYYLGVHSFNMGLGTIVYGRVVVLT